MLIVSHFKTLSFFQWKQLLTRFGVIGISMKSIDLQRKGLAKGSVNLRFAGKRLLFHELSGSALFMDVPRLYS